MSTIDHITGKTFHGRKGRITNAFRYSVDYVLLDAEAEPAVPWLFGRNARGVMALCDCDHGGAPKDGNGAGWARGVLEQNGITGTARIDLLAQPRVFGHVFNPVSFWLCYDTAQGLIAVIAEVSNTFGDRHSYLCCRDDGQAIDRSDTIVAQKIFHVSPFQPVEGEYRFRFDITPAKIGIWIDYTCGDGGLIATLTGPRAPLSNWGIIKSVVRRPFGSRRVLGLIHWQALKLWGKGAGYRARPKPPVDEVSRG